MLSPRQDRHAVNGERDWLPARLELLPGALAVAGRGELSDAQVWREAGEEPGKVVAVGEGGQQSSMEASQLLNWRRRQPERAAPRAVLEEAELGQRDGEWGVQAAGMARVSVGNSSCGRNG